MQIGFHTAAFNSAAFSFEEALKWANENDIHAIECGVIDGVSWVEGLDYYPHVPLYEDPALLKEKMKKYDVRLSSIDAAYPLSGPDGTKRGVPYVEKSIRWAAQAGCNHVVTTDGLEKPAGLSEREAMDLMERHYERIITVAEAYDITVTIEVHGYFTTDPEYLEEMLQFCDSDHLKVNMDTGNTFIAGEDPVAFLRRFVDNVAHVHIKDVSKSLAAAVRGDESGIATSHCPVGDGVNANNIRECLAILRDNGYDGVLSVEVEGNGGPMLRDSIDWVVDTMDELDIRIDKTV